MENVFNNQYVTVKTLKDCFIVLQSDPENSTPNPEIFDRILTKEQVNSKRYNLENAKLVPCKNWVYDQIITKTARDLFEEYIQKRIDLIQRSIKHHLNLKNDFRLGSDSRQKNGRKLQNLYCSLRKYNYHLTKIQTK